MAYYQSVMSDRRFLMARSRQRAGESSLSSMLRPGTQNLLSRESMKTFQELADEAFRDLLHKYKRPTDLGQHCGKA
jgi:hypothetical protein